LPVSACATNLPPRAKDLQFTWAVDKVEVSHYGEAMTGISTGFAVSFASPDARATDLLITFYKPGTYYVTVRAYAFAQLQGPVAVARGSGTCSSAAVVVIQDKKPPQAKLHYPVSLTWKILKEWAKKVQEDDAVIKYANQGEALLVAYLAEHQQREQNWKPRLPSAQIRVFYNPEG
jgi:hypothetical protein